MFHHASATGAGGRGHARRLLGVRRDRATTAIGVAAAGTTAAGAAAAGVAAGERGYARQLLDVRRDRRCNSGGITAKEAPIKGATGAEAANTAARQQGPSAEPSSAKEAPQGATGAAECSAAASRPVSAVVCSRGIALSHQRAGSSAVSAGGTGPRQEHGLGACGSVNRGRLWAGVPMGRHH